VQQRSENLPSSLKKAKDAALEDRAKQK